MNLKDLVIGVMAVAALCLGVITVFKPAITPPLGAVATNQPTEPFYFQGGMTSKAAAFVSTTTVACEVQNTTGATTSIAMIGLNVPVATTTTTVLGFATSTNAGRYATTTALGSVTLAANKQGTATYRPTSNNDILGPGEWVTVGYGAGTTLPTVAQQQTGSCAVVFQNLR